MSAEWVGKTWCVCTVGCSLAIKWSPVTCSNTDEPWEHWRSSHGGAHTLVFPCQLGARPRASSVPHAAFITGSPRGRVPSARVLAPFSFRAPEGSGPGKQLWVVHASLGAPSMCCVAGTSAFLFLQLLLPSGLFAPCLGWGLIHSSSLRSITWKSVVAALFFLFISPSHIIDGSTGWRVSGWKSFSLCSFEDCFVPFYLPKLLLRNPEPCWFRVLCAPFPPLSESLQHLTCHALRGVGLHASILLAQCILACGNVTSCPGGMLNYFFPCVFPVLSFWNCYLIFGSLNGLTFFPLSCLLSISLSFGFSL